MKSPGPDHALALHSDNTLVAWGNNDFGQLNHPAAITYTDFSSAGLVSSTKSNVALSNTAGGSTDGIAYILTSTW